MNRIIIFAAIALLQATGTFCQLRLEQKKAVIDSISDILTKKYVFEEVARSMRENLLSNLQQGKYDSINSGEAFAFQLTRDLQKISADQHLRIGYNKKVDTPGTRNGSGGQPGNWIRQLLHENNYGIKEKKIFPGNIGYLAIPMFGPLNECADSLRAAMEFVSGTDALILDLMSCRGSLDENTIPFFMSYFFGEPVQLSDFYVRETRSTRQFWSYAWVPGKRYLGKPVYILTSGRTFSGGEAFAYDMQQLKRTTIIGETTRGGANPSELIRFHPNFTISLPYARPVNPLTRSNWEQVGVKPDSFVRSNNALYITRLLALNNLLAMATSEKPKEQLNKEITHLLNTPPIFRHTRFELMGYENAEQVAVSGSFNYYAPKSFLLRKNGKTWTGETAIAPGEINYVFIVDGRRITDPAIKQTILVNGQLHSRKIIQ